MDSYVLSLASNSGYSAPPRAIMNIFVMLRRDQLKHLKCFLIKYVYLVLAECSTMLHTSSKFIDCSSIVTLKFHFKQSDLCELCKIV